MATSAPLSRCPRCTTTIRFADVVGATSLDDEFVTVGMICAECTLASHMRVAKATWQKMLGAAKAAHVETNQTPPDAEAARRADIGRTVKAARLVDLDTMTDLGDILAGWEWQERVAPETIVKEL